MDGIANQYLQLFFSLRRCVSDNFSAIQARASIFLIFLVCLEFENEINDGNDIMIKQDKKLSYFELKKSILNCCFEVMEEFGTGFLENLYKNALLIKHSD